MSAQVNSAEKQGTIPTDTSQGRPLEKGSPALEKCSQHACIAEPGCSRYKFGFFDTDEEESFEFPLLFVKSKNCLTSY